MPIEAECRLRLRCRLGTGLGPRVEFSSFTGRFLAFRLMEGEPEWGFAGLESGLELELEVRLVFFRVLAVAGEGRTSFGLRWTAIDLSNDIFTLWNSGTE